jgi:hypothetical protein
MVEAERWIVCTMACGAGKERRGKGGRQTRYTLLFFLNARTIYIYIYMYVCMYVCMYLTSSLIITTLLSRLKITELITFMFLKASLKIAKKYTSNSFPKHLLSISIKTPNFHAPRKIKFI